VRQGRRLVGDWVMTQREVTRPHAHLDSVALGCFYLDVHGVQRLPDLHAVGGARAEGGIGNLAVRAYEIPYRVLLPRQTEALNLLVTVGVSASHIAFSTLRMEPVWMALGHAAGVAAGLHLQGGQPLANLGPLVRQTLSAQGQELDASRLPDYWPPDWERAPTH